MSTGITSWAAASARRLERSGLTTPLAGRPDEVAGAMVGVHAQVMSAADVSVCLRLDGGTRDAVRHALWADRRLVKTYGPRGTVHLLPADDLPLWTGALSAVPTSNGQAPDVRMSSAQTDAVVEAIAAALTDAELTADELNDAVVAATGPWAGDLVMPAFGGMWPRWRQALHTAAHRGVLCFGPDRGRKVTYTDPHRWLPRPDPLDATTALSRLVCAYLHAYGPATAAHFARWLAAPPRWAAEVFASLDGAIEPLTVEGTDAWVVAGDTAAGADAPPPVRLLPYFDAYAIACQPREVLFPAPVAERALTGGQAGNRPVLLVDGTVAGVWHHRLSGRKVAVTVEPHVELTAALRRHLDDQVERIGAILGATPHVTIGPVQVGPHA